MRKPRGSFPSIFAPRLAACVLSGAALPLATARDASAATVSAPLARALERAGAGDTLHAWVFFRDRGLEPEAREESLRAAASSLDPHTRWRRWLRGRGARVDDRDLPVPEGYLDALRSAGARVRATSRWLLAASVTGDPAALTRVADLPFVEHLRPVAGASAAERMPASEARPLSARHSAPSPPDGGLAYGASFGQLEQMQVPELHELGLTGAGVRLAVLDTGFRRSHEALAPLHVIHEHDFIYGDSITANQAGQDTFTVWQDYHGTLILSLAGGDSPGVMYGPAFGADFILAKSEVLHYERPLEEDLWVQAIEWAESVGADVVSSSLGYFNFDRAYPDYTYEDMNGDVAVTTVAADIAVSLGVAVFNCLGNAGDDADYTKMIAPSDADSAMGIGAVDSTGAVTPYSSRGPTFDGRIKPDLCARGDIDVGAYSLGGPSGYTTDTGTSCSTPLAAGVAALLLEALPELPPKELTGRMKSTATHAASPDTLFGWGIIRGLDALGAGSTGVAAGGPVRGAPWKVRVDPNPVRGEAALQVAALRSARGGPGVVQIVAVDGRIVWERELAAPDAGEAVNLQWSGTDREGRTVPPGVYLVRYLSSGASATAKLVRLP